MELDFPDMNLPVYDYPPKVRLELLNEMQGLMIKHGLLKGATELSGFIDAGIVETVMQTQSPPGEK
ncbi:MAG: hypothetical protein HY796_12660 [Elusimicrobia bacterium]|nr:hypothetical protein [Elusimicrobiota bacterium]